MAKVLLTKAVKAELTDLYDGSWASIRELSIIFKIDVNQLAYFFDYNGRRKKHTKAARKWMDAHPEIVKISAKKAQKKWQLKNKEKLRKYNTSPERKRKARQRYKIKKYLESEKKMLELGAQQKCLFCGKPFEEIEDPIVGKKTGHLFKPTCGCHSKNVVISIG